MGDFGGYLGQAELGELIRSVLADMKPREREVVELNFRHELFDNDLAVALGRDVEEAAHSIQLVVADDLRQVELGVEARRAQVIDLRLGIVIFGLSRGLGRAAAWIGRRVGGWL